MANPGPHSALMIEVPEAEPAVRQHREHLDPSAPLGIPAHITILFPFLPPETIDLPALTKLEAPAEDSVQARLPIEASATSVTLMTQQSAGGHWTKAAALALR